MSTDCAGTRSGSDVLALDPPTQPRPDALSGAVQTGRSDVTGICCEALEARRLFAVSVSGSGSTLTITGTNSADDLTVNQDGSSIYVTVTSETTTHGPYSASTYNTLVIDVGMGNDYVGIDSDVTAFTSTSDNTVKLGDGSDDFLTSCSLNFLVYGDDLWTANNEYSHGDDQIVTGSGNDTIYGGLYDDGIFGNSGNDTIYGDDAYGGKDYTFDSTVVGDDFLWGGAGNDQMHGGYGNDVVYGEDGSDTCWGFISGALSQSDGYDDFLDGGGGANPMLDAFDDYGHAGYDDTVYVGFDGGTLT